MRELALTRDAEVWVFITGLCVLSLPLIGFPHEPLWQRSSFFVFGVCVLVLAYIIGRLRELEILRAEYQEADNLLDSPGVPTLASPSPEATDLERLKDFLRDIGLNPDRVLETLKGQTPDPFCNKAALLCLKATFDKDHLKTQMREPGFSDSWYAGREQWVNTVLREESSSSGPTRNSPA